MYCPKCFHDTLKISSSGVIKFTFDGKHKSTSQLFYNINEDTEEELLHKLNDVIEDYFSYYAQFQNKETIKNIEATSIDFKCSNGCTLSVHNRVNVIGLIYSKEEIKKSARELAKKYQLEVDLEI